MLTKGGYLSTINIGVFGPTGVGKSSLINAMLAKRPGQEGAARVGVAETTLEPTKYLFPGATNVRVWDLPGAGTPRFQRESYVKDMGLRYFDIVIIVSASRVTSTDVTLVQELDRHKVPHLIVRTKIDHDVENEAVDHGCKERATLQKIKDDMNKNGLNYAFLVSSRKPGQYDFEKFLSCMYSSIHLSRSKSRKESNCLACFEQCAQRQFHRRGKFFTGFWSTFTYCFPSAAVLPKDPQAISKQ